MTKEEAKKLWMDGWVNGLFVPHGGDPEALFEAYWSKHKPAELLDCGCMKWCVGGCL